MPCLAIHWLLPSLGKIRAAVKNMQVTKDYEECDFAYLTCALC